MSKEIFYNCPECEVDYVPNRSDQKYCKQKCRNKYNNRRYKSFKSITSNIERILRNNHRILSGLDQRILSRDELTRLGFDLKYYTSQEKNLKGMIFFCVFDMGFYIRKDNRIQVFKHQNQ